MSLKKIGEFGLIRKIQKRFSQLSSAIPLGIGDDAAAVIPSPGTYSLLTTDTLVEEIHFKRSFCSFSQIGYKAVAVNVSDIAAMGGLPRFFLISLGLTEDLEVSDFDQLYRGIARGIKENRIDIIGGNIARTKKHFFITGTLFGEVPKGQLIKRSGAEVGDALYVTGTIGDAAAGLHLLKTGKGQKTYSRLLKRYQTPSARGSEGRRLAKEQLPSAMIDLSDGLIGDLKHLIAQSGVGAELMLDQLPISRALKRYASLTKTDPVNYALYGGEDYELLLSVPVKKLKKLMQLIKSPLIQVTRIGTILSKKEGLILREANGATRKAIAQGYDHCF